MVAECLGHVALLYPDKALPLLQQQSQVRSQDAHDNPTPKRRRTVRACRASRSPTCLHGFAAQLDVLDVHAADVTEVCALHLPCLFEPNAAVRAAGHLLPVCLQCDKKHTCMFCWVKCCKQVCC